MEQSHAGRGGCIWDRIVWTVTAAAMIAATDYRNISPVLLHRKDGILVRLRGAGLVHNSTLHLTALAALENCAQPRGAGREHR